MLITGSDRWRPALGTGIIHMNTALPMHQVDDRHVGRALKGDLFFASDGAPWWACVAFSGGRIAIVPSEPDLAVRAPLAEDWRQKLVEISVIANRMIHHGGHWVTFAADGELGALWRDRDGDMHITQAWPEPWPRLKAKPQTEWVEVLEACWSAWDLRTRGIRDPRVQIMRAQGEQSRGA